MARLRSLVIIAIAISAVGLLLVTIRSISNPEPQQVELEDAGGIPNDLPEQNRTLPVPAQIPQVQEPQEFIGRLIIIPEASHEIGTRGWSGSMMVELRSILGFEGETIIAVVNLPGGVRAELVERTVFLSPGSSEDVAVQITIDETAASGSYSLTIEASRDDTIWRADVDLEIVDHLVEMKGSAFVEGNITISKGETVVWVNRDVPERFDDLRHNVISSDGVFSSPLLGTGELFRHTFENEGTFLYSCEPHPWMIGQVVVDT